MELKKDWLELVLKKEDKWNGVERVVEATAEDVVSTGDNYASMMVRVKMRVMLGSGKMVSRSVVVKKLPDLEERAELIRERGIFSKEIKVYTEILPAMELLMADAGDVREPLWIRCLEFTPNEMMVLQDLTELGYRMASRLEGLDMVHTRLALRSLARFHAMSVILKERHLFDPADYKRSIFSEMSLSEVLLNLYLPKLIKTIESDWGKEWTPYVDKIKFLNEDIRQRLVHKHLNLTSKFQVLNHGDSWTNNMLFKYASDDKTPTNLRFVDFQLSHYRSFAYDILYFFMTSVKLDLLRNHWDDLILEYFEELTHSLRLLGRGEDELPPLNELQAELQDRTILCLITSCTVNCLTILDPKDFVPIEVLITQSNDAPSPFGNKKIVERVKFALKLCSDRGFFNT